MRMTCAEIQTRTWDDSKFRFIMQCFEGKLESERFAQKSELNVCLQK